MDLRPDGAALPLERSHFVIVNQALGPFYDGTVTALSRRGHRVTVLSGARATCVDPGVTFVSGPCVDRSTLWTRAQSWIAFLRFVFANLPEHMTDTVLLSSSNPPWLPHLCSYLQSNATLHVARVLDVYPDVLRSHPHMARWPLIQRLWRIANRLAYRRCTSVVTLGDVMATTLSRYTNHAPLVIPDWSTIDARKVPPRDENPLRVELGLGDRLVVLYSGNLGLTHDLGPIIQAATHFKDDDRVRFVVVGEGPQHDRLQRDAQARGIGHLLVFVPYQSNDQLPLSMGLGDLSVVTIARGAENTCMPCKTYDYLAAGSAILAIAGRPSDVADVVDRYRCGVVIAPGDVSGLVRAIRAALPRDAWLQQMRAGARRAASEAFSAEIQCTRLVALLETTARQLRASQADGASARA